MTTIRYFIPEDGDLESQPNVFLAPKPRQQGSPPTLAEVKNSFPLPGRYHFRFKCPLVPGSDRDKGAMAVWMDITDDRQPVATWKSTIVAKVTRIGVEEDDDDDDEDFRRPSPQASTASSHTSQPRQQQPQRQSSNEQTPPPAPAKQPSFDLFDGPTHQTPAPAAPAAAAASASSHHQAADLLNAHAPAPSSSGSLLDMNFQNHNVHHSHQQNNAHSDFLGMTATPSPPVSGNYAQQMYQQQQKPMQQQQQQQQNRSNGGSFDSFGTHSQGGAFGGLGTPWKN